MNLLVEKCLKERVKNFKWISGLNRYDEWMRKRECFKIAMLQIQGSKWTETSNASVSLLRFVEINFLRLTFIFSLECSNIFNYHSTL